MIHLHPTTYFRSLLLNRSGEERGMAMLELGIMSIALFTLILGGYLASDRYSNFSTARQLVDRYIQEDAVRPMDVNVGSGGVALTLNQSILGNFIRTAADGAGVTLSSYISAKNLPGDFLVQVAYQVVNLNPSTGAITSLSPSACEGYSESGPLSGIACPELTTAISSTIGPLGSSRSYLAIPGPYFGRTTHDEGGTLEGNQFLPFAVLIGMRVEWELNSVGTSLGLPSSARYEKVAVVRGDVKL